MNFNLQIFRSFRLVQVNFLRSLCQQNRALSNDTIFGLSSGFGKCGVAVIRVSGPNTQNAITELTGASPVSSNHKSNSVENVPPIRPRFATLRRIFHPKSKSLIDRGLVLWFPKPHSFTGEDCCEFHVHGSVAVIAAVSDALNSIRGCRPATAGEFTRRAFHSDKLDLTEVEGLADLINAETEIQRKQALMQADGTLSKLYSNWSDRILRLVAHFEAYIDFAEDENIEDDTMHRIRDELVRLIDDVRKFLDDGRCGEMRREGIRMVILGEPNVGKSSFMNHICQRSISIVTDVAGTTRDIVETSFNIGGYPVVIADTAGLRKSTNDIVESEGILRATKYAKNADLIVLLVNGEKLQSFDGTFRDYIENYKNEIGFVDDEDFAGKKKLVIVNKMDLLQRKFVDENDDVIYTSCTECTGIEEAVKRIGIELKFLCGEPSAASPSLSNRRHREWMTKCYEQLLDFEENVQHYFESENSQIDFAMCAHHLREAHRCIGHITGKVNTEQILDVIFRDFCIGK